MEMTKWADHVTGEASRVVRLRGWPAPTEAGADGVMWQ